MAQRRDPIRVALAALAKALCVPLRLTAALPAEGNAEMQPFDKGVMILQNLLDEPGLLPDAAVDQVLDALENFESARSSCTNKEKEMDSGHSAVQELARHLDEGGASVDADTEEWLLNTTVPAGLSLRPSLDADSFKHRMRRGRHSGEAESSSSFSNKSRSRAMGGGKSGGMKRTMTAPVALTELAVPANSPTFSRTAALGRAGALAPRRQGEKGEAADRRPPPQDSDTVCQSAPLLRLGSKPDLQGQPPEEALLAIDEASPPGVPDAS